jgi:hypothetical protein
VNSELVEKIANAVLYEGYLLYPYRSSAVKNQQRWNFGVLYPKAYSGLETGSDRSDMRTQCLIAGGPLTSVSVKLRCLRLVERVAGYLAGPVAVLPRDQEPEFHPAPAIEINGRVYESWQEAAECDIERPAYHLAEIAAGPIARGFTLQATRAVEELRDESGLIAGLIVRTQSPVEGFIEIAAEESQAGLFRLTVRIENVTALDETAAAGRDLALAKSLVSAHTIIRVRNGALVSLLDPAAQYAESAAACQNLGTWPVLVGEPGQTDTMLSSPIILYDYPQIAAESPGDLFDSTEIDEILALRILTLTDDEKDAMRRSDDRARRILERTETLPPEHFMKLHGALRGLRPVDREVS